MEKAIFYHLTPEVLFTIKGKVALGRKCLLIRIFHITILKIAFFTGNVYFRDEQHGSYKVYPNPDSWDIEERYSYVCKLKCIEKLNKTIT